jgi:hypothetical protein
MGDRLVVDGDGLIELSSTLSRITEDLDATRSLIDGVRSELGSSDLWDALDDFEDNWDDGRGQINKNVTAMREVIDEAVRAYEEGDQSLADELRKQMDPEGAG